MFQDKQELHNHIHTLALSGMSRDEIVAAILGDASDTEFQIIATVTLSGYVYDLLRKTPPSAEVAEAAPPVRVPTIIKGKGGTIRPSSRASRDIENDSLSSSFRILLECGPGKSKWLPEFNAEDCMWRASYLDSQGTALLAKSGRWTRACEVLTSKGVGAVLGDLPDVELKELDLT